MLVPSGCAWMPGHDRVLRAAPLSCCSHYGVSAFRRYVLLQVPGWLVAIVVLYWLHGSFGLPFHWAAGIYAAYVVKDFLLYPFLRRAYEEGAHSGTASLVGETGIVTQAIDPAGYIRVRGELWQARTPDARRIPKGASVRVKSAAGMVLMVEKESAATDET